MKSNLHPSDKYFKRRKNGFAEKNLAWQGKNIKVKAIFDGKNNVFLTFPSKNLEEMGNYFKKSLVE